MEIKLNIAKKHIYILMVFVLVIAGVALVIGYKTTDPTVFGHSSGEITVTINGAETSLQEAIDTLSAGGAEALTLLEAMVAMVL